MADERKVKEERAAFEAIDWDSEDLIGLEEIGPDSELDEADLEGLADLEAGRVISNEAVLRWLKDWSNGIRRPPPQVGE